MTRWDMGKTLAWDSRCGGHLCSLSSRLGLTKRGEREGGADLELPKCSTDAETFEGDIYTTGKDIESVIDAGSKLLPVPLLPLFLNKRVLSRIVLVLADLKRSCTLLNL